MSTDTPAPEGAPTATPEAPEPGSNAVEKPAEDTTDWKAESRKWEGLAKKDKDDAEAWRKHQESQKSEDEKRAARERELEERAVKAEAKALRSEIADTKNVPVEWREFLSGSTEEELNASADKILNLIANKPGSTPDPNQGNPADAPAGDFLREAARH